MLLPTALRRSKMISLMRALIAPIVRLQDAHRRQCDETLFRLQHTPQTCYLRHALNHEFDIATRAEGFEIEDIRALGDYVVIFDEDNEGGRFDLFMQFASDEIYTVDASRQRYYVIPTDEAAADHTPLMAAADHDSPMLYSELEISVDYFCYAIENPFFPYSESDIEVATKSFVVWCPLSIYERYLARVRAVTNRYRLLSRTAQYKAKL